MSATTNPNVKSPSLSSRCPSRTRSPSSRAWNLSFRVIYWRVRMPTFVNNVAARWTPSNVCPSNGYPRNSFSCSNASSSISIPWPKSRLMINVNSPSIWICCPTRSRVWTSCRASRRASSNTNSKVWSSTKAVQIVDTTTRSYRNAINPQVGWSLMITAWVKPNNKKWSMMGTVVGWVIGAPRWWRGPRTPTYYFMNVKGSHKSSKNDT